MKSPPLSVTSAVFEHNATIPRKHTCQGDNVNPPLTIGSIPAGTKSLALIVDDPDAAGQTFDHWILWNIPATGTIAENSIPGTEGKNHFGITHYKGPCPPSGTHRYFFKVFALDRMLDLKTGAGRKDLERNMQSHLLASGEIIGLYKKS